MAFKSRTKWTRLGVARVSLKGYDKGNVPTSLSIGLEGSLESPTW